MFRDPSGALDEMVTLATSSVDEIYVVEFTTMPVPEKESEAPLRRFVPVTTTSWFVAPCSRELGSSDVTVGAPIGGGFAAGHDVSPRQ
jgi:hypothetical protein